MDFPSWNMKHINTIYEVWQGIVYKKYIIVVVSIYIYIYIYILECKILENEFYYTNIQI
jgi:hypothetical protein